MAKITKLPPSAETVIHKAKSAAAAFALVQNAIVEPANDTPINLVGAQHPEFYAVKAEGESILYQVNGGLSGAPRGAFYYEYPNSATPDRNRKFVAMPDDKIYMYKGSDMILVRDVAADGFSITSFSAFQTKKYLYASVGDSGMGSYLYRYDGTKATASIEMTEYIDTTFPLWFPVYMAGQTLCTSIAHGLASGMTVTIEGSTSYDGDYLIKVMSDDTFAINIPFGAVETGTWEAEKMTMEAMPGLASPGIVCGMDNRIAVSGTGLNRGNVQYSDFDITGVHENFVPGTSTVAPGVLAGNTTDVRAMIYFKGMTFAFEPRRISVHRIGDAYFDGATLLKDNNSLEEAFTVDGFGTTSPYGACSGRGQVFYVDNYAGVFSYSASGSGDSVRLGGKELSLPIHDQLVDGFNLEKAAIAYHPGKDLLMVACSSVEGGENDRVFYYNFLTKAWSIDTTKFIRQFIWDEVEGQMYGISSILPALIKVFDGTHSDYLRQPMEMVVQSHYFDGGRRSQLKEYIESSLIVGGGPSNGSFTYELFTDSSATAQATDVVNILDAIPTEQNSGPEGPSGEGSFGVGFTSASSSTVSGLSFVQYYNDEAIDEHRRVSARVTEDSAAPFLVYSPEIICEILDDETDDDFA